MKPQYSLLRLCSQVAEIRLKVANLEKKRIKRKFEKFFENPNTTEKWRMVHLVTAEESK